MTMLIVVVGNRVNNSIELLGGNKIKFVLNEYFNFPCNRRTGCNNSYPVTLFLEYLWWEHRYEITEKESLN